MKQEDMLDNGEKMATQSFFEDLVLNTPEAVRWLEDSKIEI